MLARARVEGPIRGQVLERSEAEPPDPTAEGAEIYTGIAVAGDPS